MGGQAGGTTILQSGMCHFQLGMWGARLSGNRFGRPGPGESEPRPTPEHHHHEGADGNPRVRPEATGFTTIRAKCESDSGEAHSLGLY